MTTYTQPAQGAAPYAQYAGSVPPQDLRQEIKTFADKSKALASQILHQHSPKSFYTGPRIIRHHHYYDPFYSPWYRPSLFYQPPVVIVGDHRGCRNDRRNDDSASIFLGVAATIGALFVTYAIGSAKAGFDDAEYELRETRDMQQRLHHCLEHSSQTDLPLIQEALKAADLKGRICSRMRNSSEADLALRVSLAVGLASTAVGFFTGCVPVLAVGLTIGLCSAGALLLRWGFESNDRMNMRDAQSLKKSISRLNRL